MSASTRRSQPELERALALARGAQPSELAATDLRRLVRQSVVEAAERRARLRLRRRMLVLAGALGCAAVLGFVWKNRALPAQPARRAELAWSPLELALPTGDKLSASPGAQFELVQSTAVSRRIALREGIVVFSIAPLASGETFSVQTPHAYVEVRGTVFTIEVGHGRTRVRVHEGAVQIQGSGPPRTLRAGERFGSDGEPVPELLSTQLARRAVELVDERERERASLRGSQEAEPAARDAAIGPGSEPPLLGADHAARTAGSTARGEQLCARPMRFVPSVARAKRPTCTCRHTPRYRPHPARRRRSRRPTCTCAS